MIKSNKNNKKKKKGFTLVELIAVIAIIGILSAMLIPTIGGYITKAKKTKVVEQARTFVMAVESLAAENKLGSNITKNNATINNMGTNKNFVEIVGASNNTVPEVLKVLPKLNKDFSYTQASNIAAGGAFDIDENGNFKEPDTIIDELDTIIDP